jgi:large conductance mechanosensitive channel
MKSFFAEFRAFALRGNILDLAIGIVIGTAFNNIVTSFVTNILTPPLGLLTGKINFKDLVWNPAGSVKIEYGLFIQSIISFVITAFGLFLIIRLINRLEKIAQKEPPVPTPDAAKSDELLVLEEIRDSLKPKT